MNTLLPKAIAQIEGNRILVCPLDWGLGHATRCVPIIRALLTADKQVILAADGAAYQFLQQEFPHLPLVRFAGLTVRYSASRSQVGAMLAQLPKFVFQIARERRNLQKIIALHKIDAVISDNRFGLWTRRAQCIYITHQLMVKMPPRWRFLEKTVWKIHRKIIQKYDFCWIPDSETEQLAGDLAHKYKLPKNGVFIGIISRFDAQKKCSKSADFDAIGITVTRAAAHTLRGAVGAPFCRRKMALPRCARTAKRNERTVGCWQHHFLQPLDNQRNATTFADHTAHCLPFGLLHADGLAHARSHCHASANARADRAGVFGRICHPFRLRYAAKN